jgi:branched-chain amino acid transport system permease protein
LTFLNAYPVISIAIAFVAGMTTSMLAGIVLERIAYRPLRQAPRLVPLISAIGASIFLEEAARLMFGAQTRPYHNPDLLKRGTGIEMIINAKPVLITYTGIFTILLSLLLLGILLFVVRRTKLGRAMRAVAQDKKTAALMGIDVDGVISRTFAISGLLAGAAGVMWGVHNGQVDFFIGFVPGIKAFTAAVLGGIGNLPGALLGGMLLGIVESVGPAALGIDFQLKDVIGFSILVIMLIFRPSGLLGEALSEEKV